MESSTRGPAIAERAQAERLGARLARTRAALRAVAADISEEELVWRPDEGILSPANHLFHVARFEEALVARVLLGRTVRRRKASEFEDQTRRETAWYLERLAGARALTQGWLDRVTDEDLHRHRTPCGPWGETAADLLDFLSHHDIHHRAAIITLRKLIDPGRVFHDLE